MGQNWEPPQSAPEPRKRRRSRKPKFGAYTELTAVMGLLRGDLTSYLVVTELRERYPWRAADTQLVTFVFDARALLAVNDLAGAERLAHEFIHHTLEAKPEPPPPRRRRWRRRKH